jgi:hypothetical protein
MPSELGKEGRHRKYLRLCQGEKKSLVLVSMEKQQQTREVKKASEQRKKLEVKDEVLLELSTWEDLSIFIGSQNPPTPAESIRPR